MASPCRGTGVSGQAMLIRHATDLAGRRCELLIRDGRIAAMADRLEERGATVIDAGGGLVIAGLRDHHLHLYAEAVRGRSLACEAASVGGREGLARALRCARPDAQGWIRGVGFHPEELGALSRDDLDAWRGDCPVRIQHASGRLWYCNSAAIRALGDGPWRIEQGINTGELPDADAWLRDRLGGTVPDLSELSAQMARFGVVAVTDTGPRNDAQTLRQLRAAFARGELRQRVLMMGDASLDALWPRQVRWFRGVRPGPHKFHLLESDLPDLDVLVAAIRASHQCGRPVAFHCVSRTELVFALAALESAGSLAGDRIEHGGVCPAELIPELRRLGLTVVSQPGFIASRGDRYVAEVDADDLPHLYRLGTLLRANVGLAGSSDAPHGDLNPWRGMAAAVDRLTAAGALLGGDERVTPEQALGLYSGDLLCPRQPLTLSRGGWADLCVLDRPWSQLRENLARAQVLMSLSRGQPVWSAPGLTRSGDS